MLSSITERLRRLGSRCRLDALFSLAPAFSLGEKEPLTPDFEHTGCRRFVRALTPSLPLPKGEDRGEGEEHPPLLTILGSYCCPRPAGRVLHIIYLAFLFTTLPLVAAEPWQDALSRMPLGTNVAQLNRTNCVGIMLNALRSNDVVKALVFMPGATDEFYFFRRAKANLPDGSLTLLDALGALTNQTLIRATFQPPLLLLHTSEDLLDPGTVIQDAAMVEKLKRAHFVRHGLFNDRDWVHLQPVLKSSLRVSILPWKLDYSTIDFYRHSFAAWNLNGWDALRATAFAGQTRFTVRRKDVFFELDMRPRVAPKLDAFPQ